MYSKFAWRDRNYIVVSPRLFYVLQKNLTGGGKIFFNITMNHWCQAKISLDQL